jgi:Ser/Thr protein kinase RdoA (MazF antagonist)
MTALMHQCFMLCPPPVKPAGHDYDKALTVKMTQRLHAMVKEGWLPSGFADDMVLALMEIGRRMEELDVSEGSYGIVHSDLSKSNMISSGLRVSPIDFGLWGYGYYYMDLGCLASHFTDEAQQEAIFRGYESVSGRIVDRRYVTPFVCLGILLYICTFANSVHGEDWFLEALERWSRTFFRPLGLGTDN